MYSTIWCKCYRWTKMKIFYEFLILCKLTTNSNIWETSEIFANITGGLLAITGSSLALITYSACLRKKYVWEINLFQSIRDFKTSYVLTIKFISTHKEAPKLLWNFKLFYLPIKFNYYKNNNFSCLTKRLQDFMFYILRPLSKNMGNMHSFLANHITHIFTC